MDRDLDRCSEQRANQPIAQGKEENEGNDPQTLANDRLEHAQLHLLQIGQPFVNNQVLMFRFHGSYEVNWGYSGIKSGGWQGGGWAKAR